MRLIKKFAKFAINPTILFAVMQLVKL